MVGPIDLKDTVLSKLSPKRVWRCASERILSAPGVGATCDQAVREKKLINRLRAMLSKAEGLTCITGFFGVKQMNQTY
jgi:hypothetical protein